MTEEEIIKLAIEHTISGLKFDQNGLLNFASFIVSTEREACAKICDDWPNGRDDVWEIGNAIRARTKA